MGKDDRLLNWMEVCTRLGCGRSQFYVLVNSGQLPHTRIGKSRGIRVSEADLAQFIRTNRSNGSPKSEKNI